MVFKVFQVEIIVQNETLVIKLVCTLEPPEEFIELCLLGSHPNHSDLMVWSVTLALDF